MKNTPKYNPIMNNYAIFPYNINILHFYAYYNLPLYLEKALKDGGTIFPTNTDYTVLSIAVKKNLMNCIAVIVRYLKKNSKFNPFLASCITDRVLQKLNKLGHSNLHILYGILMIK